MVILAYVLVHNLWWWWNIYWWFVCIDHGNYLDILYDGLGIYHSDYLGIVDGYVVAYGSFLGMLNVLQNEYDVKVEDPNEINGWLFLGIYLRHV